jgi:SAM-dependent methyltransferase
MNDTVRGVPLTTIVSPGEHAERWCRLLTLPGQSDLRSSLVAELSQFTRLSPRDVEARMHTALADFAANWQRLVTDPRSEAQLVAFYNADMTEAFELAAWHAGDCGAYPLKYLSVMDFAARRGLRHVLDFGSGIGSGTILFAQAGCEVTYADISRPLREFATFRLGLRGLEARPLDLQQSEPERGAYDLICAFDVLEHMPDQLATLARLRARLRPGGWLVANFFPDGSLTPDRPMHISTAGDVARFLTRTGLWADWAATAEFAPYRSDGLALRKTWWAPVANRLRRLRYALSRWPGGDTPR